MEEASNAAREVLAADVARQLRARAWLVVLEVYGESIGQASDEVDAALVDAAGDPATEHWVRMHAGAHHFMAGRSERALAEAAAAADMAAAAGGCGGRSTLPSSGPDLIDGLGQGQGTNARTSGCAP